MSSIQLWPLLAFALSVTLPIFAMAASGALFKRIGLISDEFVRSASALVFNVGLPVTLFINAASTDFTRLVSGTLIGVLAVSTLLVFVLSFVSTLRLVKERSDRGVYVQGAFRGNLLIIGLAFCANAYGEAGLAAATVPVGVMIILYNVLSVYILHVTLRQDTGRPAAALAGIATNPLILGVAAGLLLNVSGLALPDLLLDVGGYFSRMTLPLALLCIGAGMDLSALRRSGSAALGSSLWKLLASPLAACLLALALGVRGENLGIIFLLSAAPTAAASFMMTRAMGGNAGLAANIVVLSTSGSIVTVTGGLMVLKALELV